MLHRWFILLLIVFSHASFAQPKENRVALVVGNSTYKSAPLRNPTNDAKDMAAKLKGMGFTVIERSNLTVKQIGSTLREFRAKLTPGSVALVFYAGHGVQIKGENYLPAVDADISSEEDVPTQSLAMRQIMDVLGDAKTRLNLVFLDACRNNPYARSFRSASDGLNRVNAPSGTLISFATRPGSVAADGTGRNGLYTGALLEQMNNQNQPIEQILKKVVSQVKAASKSQQEPWMEGSIEGEFCFGECGKQVAQSVVSDDRVFWESVKDSRDENEVKAYLEQFPRGIFAGIARARVAALEKVERQVEISKPTQLSTPVEASLATTSNKNSMYKDCDDCPLMIPIASGIFTMGTQRGNVETTRPEHMVNVSQFSIGKTEITQKQWSAIMGRNPSQFVKCGDECPVDNVSWPEIQEYIKKLNDKTGKKYRLPSEAEWEYAARAGTQTRYYFGDDTFALDKHAWFFDNSSSTTHLVASKLPNAFGLHDVHGNVSEWVNDCWNQSYVGAPNNGNSWVTGDCTRRVIRGGSWDENPFRNANDLRVDYRYGAQINTKGNYIGFRIAVTP